MNGLKVAKFDAITDIRSTLDLILKLGDVFEVRLLGARLKGDYRDGVVYSYFDNIDAFVEQLSRLEYYKGAYFTPNPVNPVLLSKACNVFRAAGKGDTTKDHEITQRHWLLIDVDYTRPTGISTTEQEHRVSLDKVVEIVKYLAGMGWPDPIMGDSGNGGHLMYRIDEPNDDQGLISECLEALNFTLGNEKCVVDEANSNPARIWKLYGTETHKGDDTPDRPHRPARLLHMPDICHIVPTSKLKALARRKPQKASQSTQAPNQGFDLGEWLGDLTIDVKGPTHKNIHGDTAQLWTLDICPWNEAHNDDSAFVFQFDKSRKVAAGCQHNGCKGKGWHDMRLVFEPDYKSRAETGLSLDSSQRITRDARGDGKSHRYTQEELEEIAHSQSCAPQDVAWAVTDGDDVYFRTRHGYDKIHTKHLQAYFAKYLHPVPGVDVYEEPTRPGREPGLRALSKMLLEYSVPAKKIVLSFTAPTSRFNRNTGTFRVAVAPLADIKPEYNPKIAKYLRLLGGAQHDKLQAFLQTLLELDYPTAALFIHGDGGGSGKSEIFAKGLARLWEHGYITSLSKAFSRFNDKVLKCPLMLADEGIPTDPEFTKMFRSWTAGNAHEVERKFGDTVDLEGCPRIIITSNDDDLDFQGSHGANAFKALYDRILAIKVGPEARQFLEDPSQVTFQEKNAWLKGGIARHVLYLIEKRGPLEMKGRFLVMGNLNADGSVGMALDTVTTSISKFVAKLVENRGMKARAQREKLLIEDGELKLNSSGVEDAWGHYCEGDIRPNVKQIGKALKALSKPDSGGKKQKRKGINLFVMDTERLARWSSEHYISYDDFMKTIETGFSDI